MTMREGPGRTIGLLEVLPEQHIQLCKLQRDVSAKAVELEKKNGREGHHQDTGFIHFFKADTESWIDIVERDAIADQNPVHFIMCRQQTRFGNRVGF